ncbi:MAG: alpha/beta hydrolase [Sphingobacteriales bacterium]|nr:MAG: alpha/beta hydrolase [Sphingobacteriales bacterium]
MKKISSNGFHCAGNGPTLLLLHGLFTDSRVWESLFSNLSQNYFVLTLDLKWLNNSTHKNIDTIEEMAKEICKVLQKTWITETVIVGHSIGGVLGLALAEKHPEVVKGLMLFHSTALADCEQKHKEREFAIQSIKANGAKSFVRNFVQSQMFTEEFAGQSPEIVQKITDHAAMFTETGLTSALKAMMCRADRTPLLKELTCPVGFIAGEIDKQIPLKNTLSECYLPQISKLNILSDVGHAGMIERSAETLKMVKEFTQFCYEMV